MTAAKNADTIAQAARRLHQAARSPHFVVVRLREVAEWLELAAEVHAGRIPCEWCQTGRCPAVDAAAAILGQPQPYQLAHPRPTRRRRRGSDPR